MKRLVRIAIPVVMLAVLAACSGMNTTEQRTLSGAAIGAVGGAAIGGIAGGDVGTGALVGAGVGAAAGYLYDQSQGGY